jgi:hypothetical protein
VQNKLRNRLANDAAALLVKIRMLLRSRFPVKFDVKRTMPSCEEPPIIAETLAPAEEDDEHLDEVITSPLREKNSSMLIIGWQELCCG